MRDAGDSGVLVYLYLFGGSPSVYPPLTTTTTNKRNRASNEHLSFPSFPPQHSNSRQHPHPLISLTHHHTSPPSPPGAPHHVHLLPSPRPLAPPPPQAPQPPLPTNLRPLHPPRLPLLLPHLPAARPHLHPPRALLLSARQRTQHCAAEPPCLRERSADIHDACAEREDGGFARRTGG